MLAENSKVLDSLISLLVYRPYGAVNLAKINKKTNLWRRPRREKGNPSSFVLVATRKIAGKLKPFEFLRLVLDFLLKLITINTIYVYVIQPTKYQRGS